MDIIGVLEYRTASLLVIAIIALKYLLLLLKIIRGSIMDSNHQKQELASRLKINELTISVWCLLTN